MSSAEFPVAASAEFAVRDGQIISRGRLWSDVELLAPRLPDHPHVLNLCEDRYLFCLVLLAALSRGQCCLLPPSGQSAAIAELLQDFPNSYVAAETRPQDLPLRWWPVAQPEQEVAATAPQLDFQRPAIIAFTSGSTGTPKACSHTLETFRLSAGMALAALGLDERPLLVVSTTPPQHMYGLETSVFWPLFSRLALLASRPFFPEDIRRAIAAAPLPCLLASTPTHLRLLAQTSAEYPNLAGILSSTAPLSRDLAEAIEAKLGAPVREIYGSSETLCFASRRVLDCPAWQLFAGARLRADDSGGFQLASPHLRAPIALQDQLQLEREGRFAALGRSEDMIKIGGKRGSLAELNRRLLAIAGVDDGVVLVREDSRGESRTVVIVAGIAGKAEILDGLRRYVDEVFLPRRIVFVPAVPRSPTGKVIKAEADALLAGAPKR